MRHAGFPNLTRAYRSARWPGRLDWWFPAARRVVRVEAAVPPRGSSEAVEVAEHERSLELWQLERRSGETQTETISIAVSSMGAGLHDVAEARDSDFLSSWAALIGPGSAASWRETTSVRSCTTRCARWR
jgi:hypothetical protein